MVRAGTGGMPELVPPMLAASGDLPTGPGWAVEFAWDGLRCIAYARPGRVRLLTARDRSVSSTFPELHVLAAKAPRQGVILDGTVVALDDAGIPSRRMLMRRTATQRPGAALVAEVPVGFFVSDLVWLDGESTTSLPYRRRRELIDDLGLAEQPVVLSPSWPAGDAGHVLATARRYGLDGVFAKRLDSAYQPGRRSRNWLRVPLRRSRQVVVGGWTPASADRPDSVAALLLGVPGPEGLRYVGRAGVGAGTDRAAVTALVPDLHSDSSPFVGEVPASVARDAMWVVPRLVGLVEFTEWTMGGRLRLPVWRGLVTPEEVDDALWDDGPDLDGPAAGRPAADGPDADRPAADGPGAYRAVSDRAVTDRAVTDRAATARTPVDRPNGGRPESDRATDLRANGDGATGDGATGDGATGDGANLDRERGDRTGAGTAAEQAPPGPGAGAAPAALPSEARVHARRLEQHFVYNSLNTIASLVRTDPGRARDLLLGFADLTRAADRPAEETIGLRDELDTVRAYLELERARFGKRLTASVTTDEGLDDVPVVPLSVLVRVRSVVQEVVEPRPEGGAVSVHAAMEGSTCVVTVAEEATAQRWTVPLAPAQV
ncbi:histidine kinase [Pseudonocardia dioxanivorans]|uniref:ATP-dependent DNA ligase n=2 Tax=Pseudonocardia TaxID=1847 RepID=UPI001FB7DD7A|nr:histidine kinase [Pseudonocardia dioxanivorans]